MPIDSDTPNITAMEADHLATLNHPELKQMMTPDQVAGMLVMTRESLLLNVRRGNFPLPDAIIGSGPRAIRRWFPATVWEFVRAQRDKVAA